MGRARPLYNACTKYLEVAGVAHQVSEIASRKGNKRTHARSVMYNTAKMRGAKRDGQHAQRSIESSDSSKIPHRTHQSVQQQQENRRHNHVLWLSATTWIDSEQLKHNERAVLGPPARQVSVLVVHAKGKHQRHEARVVTAEFNKFVRGDPRIHGCVEVFRNIEKESSARHSSHVAMPIPWSELVGWLVSWLVGWLARVGRGVQVGVWWAWTGGGGGGG
jgi:hypothetical protein